MDIILNKVVGNQDLSLIIKENFISDLIKELKDMENQVNMENECYFEAFTNKHSSKEESLEDIDNMINYLLEILKNPEMLLSVLDDLPKKKNGTLYKNRNIVLKELNFCTDFWTDFTNAWNIPSLRVKSFEDKKCYLEFIEVQHTH